MTPEFSYLFPGTNLQDLNLDWIIEEIQSLEQRVHDLEEKINVEGG